MESNNNATAWQPSSALKAAEINDYTKSRIQRNSQQNQLQVAKNTHPEMKPTITTNYLQLAGKMLTTLRQ